MIDPLPTTAVHDLVPRVDLINLWECVHRYLAAQAAIGVGDDAAVLALGRIADELRVMHNDLHARYIAPLDAALADRPIAGVE